MKTGLTEKEKGMKCTMFSAETTWFPQQLHTQKGEQ